MIRICHTLPALVLLGGSLVTSGCARPSAAVNVKPSQPVPVTAPTQPVAATVAPAVVKDQPAPAVAAAPAREKLLASPQEVKPTPTLVRAQYAPVEEPRLKTVTVPQTLVQAQPDSTKAPASAPSGKPFQYPADQGGKVLSELLKPAERLAFAFDDLPPGQQLLQPGADVSAPGLPLPSTPAAPILAVAPKDPTLLPRLLAEAQPLANYRDDPSAPTRRELETGTLVAVPLLDVRQPVALGNLGLPMLDRVPLEDPTTEASVSAALAATPPARVDPVPFAPQNLPDPFVNAQTVKLPVPPAEEKEPQASTPRLPPTVPVPARQ